MKLVHQYMTIFFNFSPTANHLHPLQVENCDSNSRLVVDEDDNGKFRLHRVILVNAVIYTSVLCVYICTFSEKYVPHFGTNLIHIIVSSSVIFNVYNSYKLFSIALIHLWEALYTQTRLYNSPHVYQQAKCMDSERQNIILSCMIWFIRTGACLLETSLLVM